MTKVLWVCHIYCRWQANLHHCSMVLYRVLLSIRFFLIINLGYFLCHWFQSCTASEFVNQTLTILIVLVVWREHVLKCGIRYKQHGSYLDTYSSDHLPVFFLFLLKPEVCWWTCVFVVEFGSSVKYFFKGLRIYMYICMCICICIL